MFDKAAKSLCRNAELLFPSSAYGEILILINGSKDPSQDESPDELLKYLILCRWSHFLLQLPASCSTAFSLWLAQCYEPECKSWYSKTAKRNISNWINTASHPRGEVYSSLCHIPSLRHYWNIHLVKLSHSHRAALLSFVVTDHAVHDSLTAVPVQNPRRKPRYSILGAALTSSGDRNTVICLRFKPAGLTPNVFSHPPSAMHIQPPFLIQHWNKRTRFLRTGKNNHRPAALGDISHVPAQQGHIISDMLAPTCQQN